MENTNKEDNLQNPQAGQNPSEDLGEEALSNVTLEAKTGIQPIVVTYCETCRFPEEYCPEAHAVLFKKKKLPEEEQIKETPVTEEKAAETPKEGQTTEEPKKDKKKKPKDNLIVVECSKRGKRKHTTYVSNVEKFGLNMKDVAKLFSKKFACSSTVTKEDNGTECITLTGEFGYEIVEFLTEKFPNIKAENCKVIEPKD